MTVCGLSLELLFLRVSLVEGFLRSLYSKVALNIYNISTFLSILVIDKYTASE